MPVALTRSVSPLITECELTHLDRYPIDLNKAIQQHKDYEEALQKMGYSIRRLPDTPHLPDSVFVEDTAIVFPEIGVITRPGAASRIAETESMAEILSEYRKLEFIKEPGTMDGGDILVMGKKVYAGNSERTNMSGILQLRNILSAFGYDVVPVPVEGCLHLKTGIAVLEDDLLLLNYKWVQQNIFSEYRVIHVHPDEPYGANVMRHKNFALCPQRFTYTADLLHRQGYDVITIDQSELAKAEAGLTCCSVIVN